ncbi:unnamed protein product [Durusdinium trenchii]|uniref:EF-hand domain-containing protein n=1 Tax=Durusdinium trenchii TaxID=1381693 RepID=A0ABP0IFJ8_9DINO
MQSILARALLMLIVWIKTHPGNPDLATHQVTECSAELELHDCPCVNDGSLVKAILDHSQAPEPARRLFDILDNLVTSETKQLLEALSAFEHTIDIFSGEDVVNVFSLLDIYCKGYITPNDLRLVFGHNLYGKTMEELVGEAGAEYFTYKQLWKHLLSSAGSVGAAEANEQEQHRTDCKSFDMFKR